MLGFVSDLHLSDTTARATIDVAYFIEQLGLLAKYAEEKKIEQLKIVLLGDIFEVLKSTKWLEHDVRPWQPCKVTHVDTVAGIFKDILESNPSFFEGLRKLVADYPFVKLEYIPGNHDLPLNTEMGVKARESLTKSLPLQVSGAEAFQNYLIDESHGVIARHGHEWDSSNRYGNGLSAIGDVIVIDLLLQLPIIVARNIGIEVDDPRLIFLHELDNVRPQSPGVMAQWTLRGLDSLNNLEVSGRKAVENALHEVASLLKAAIGSSRFESIELGTWWMSFLTKLAPAIVKHLGSLSLLRHLVGDDLEMAGPYREYALNDFEMADLLGGNFRYIICGHTHRPQLVPLDLVGRDQRARLYLNTGTWRRVHSFPSVASGTDGNAAFAQWDEQCLVTIYSDKERSIGFPAYEFNRITRGPRS